MHIGKLFINTFLALKIQKTNLFHYKKCDFKILYFNYSAFFFGHINKFSFGHTQNISLSWSSSLEI